MTLAPETRIERAIERIREAEARMARCGGEAIPDSRGKLKSTTKNTKIRNKLRVLRVFVVIFEEIMKSS